MLIDGKSPLNDSLGYGISTSVGDGDSRVLEIDHEAQTVSFEGQYEPKWTFREFVNLREAPDWP